MVATLFGRLTLFLLARLGRTGAAAGDSALASLAFVVVTTGAAL